MKKTTLSIISTLIICGCSFSKDALYPSLFSTQATPQENTAPQVSAPITAPTIAQQTKFEPIKVAAVKNTGTLVGSKVISFRKDLESIQSNISSNSEELNTVKDSILKNSASYHATLAAIESRLQVGTTPGNPEVYEMLSLIQANIQNMDANSIALEQISRRITADADLSASLLDSIRSTFIVSGAVDEDHRQLRILENETAQTSILIQSVLSEINTDYARQMQYSQTAKNYINELSRAVKVGNFGGSSEILPSYQAPAKAFTKPEYKGVSSPALMTINVSNKTANYKEALISTVKQALNRKPNAIFDVVSLNSNSPKEANSVFQEIINLGVNPANVNISAIKDNSNQTEVQIFVK